MQTTYAMHGALICLRSSWEVSVGVLAGVSKRDSDESRKMGAGRAWEVL